MIEPLRSEWSDAHAAALILASEGKTDEAVNILRVFHHRLCSVRVLDPACGSGNFLYVTLEHLKRLEGEVLNALDELGFRQPGLAIDGKRADAFGAETVDPHQLLGIELNPRAAAIAEVVLWIGYLQWHYRTRGEVNPPQPVIRDFRNIENRDAVLAYDHMEYITDDRGVPVTRWDGVTMKKSPVTGEDIPDDSARIPIERYVNPRKAVWPQADFVVGNPPFIGKRNMRISLGDGYVEALRETWPQVPDSADFVMHWWQHAATLTQLGALQRFGFITTNSIRQTFNRRVIEAALAPTTTAPAPSSRRKPRSSSANKKLHSGVRRNDEDKGSTPLSLVFAIPDHPWVDTADGAAVRIAMTVCEAGKRAGQWNEVHTERAGDQDEVIVDTHDRQGVIQADLTIGANLRLASTLGANAELSNIGVIPLGAGFWISKSDADTLGEGLPALLRARLLREYRNGRDLTDRPRHIFAIDTYGFDEAELRSKAPRIWQWLDDRVKPDRDQNPRRGRRENWWRYGEDHPRARRAIENLPRYLATVMTAKHRVFQFLDGCLLPDQKLVVIGLDDAYFLGVLSSEAHVTWAIAQGSTLEDRPVYVKTACFERFPFPLVGDHQRVHLRTLAEQLDAHRKRQQAAHPDLTLTGMYNVLEKLRSGEPLTAKERTIHEHGLVSVLRQLHDEIDAAVLDAYGWSDLLPLLRIAMGMDARVPRAQATAGMPEVEQRMEQLPDAQDRPMGNAAPPSSAVVGAATAAKGVATQPTPTLPNPPGPQAQSSGVHWRADQWSASAPLHPLEGVCLKAVAAAPLLRGQAHLLTRDDAKRAFNEAILERLVALNAERAAEEARGLVRWLRPEFQNPSAATIPEQAEIATERDETNDAQTRHIAAKPLPWPKDAVDQVRAVADVLTASPLPLSVDEIGTRFSARGPWKKRLPQLLDMLVALGRAQENAGRYSTIQR